MNSVVIGSGFGDITAALRLRTKNHIYRIGVFNISTYIAQISS